MKKGRHDPFFFLNTHYDRLDIFLSLCTYFSQETLELFFLPLINNTFPSSFLFHFSFIARYLFLFRCIIIHGRIILRLVSLAILHMKTKINHSD